MSRSPCVGAAMLTAAAVLIASPAGAAPINHYASAHPSSCWHYNHHTGQWLNFCRTYSYRYVYPPSEPAFPGFAPGYYPFQYQPPPASNGPYYGYEPYNGYESALGLWF